MAPKAKQVSIEDEWRRELVVQWGGIVIKTARKFHKGHIPDDVIQEGQLGLCIAAAHFDPSLGFQFATYAQHWVKAKILEHMLRFHGPMRIGTTKQERRVFFNLGKNRLTMEDSNEVLAARLRVDERLMERMRVRLAQVDPSFDTSANDRSRPLDIASDDPSAEDTLAASEEGAELRRAVRLAVKKLDERERFIIEQRFLRVEPKTLQEIGDGLGLSRERVRQLEERAKKRLARLLLSKERDVA